VIGLTAFNEAWQFLKTEPIDMHQGSDGTWRAPQEDITPEKKLWQQIQARNAQARQNLSEDVSHAPTQEELEAHPDFGKTWFPNYIPKDYTGNTMVNSETGNYDPNDPKGWHPMGEPELPEGMTMGNYLERQSEQNPEHRRLGQSDNLRR
jgi:hypothetical protein